MKVYLHARQLVLDSLPKDGIGAEVGVFKGDYSAQILQRTNPKTLHLIDPWRSVAVDTHRSAMYGSDNRSPTDMDNMYASVKKRFEPQLASKRIIIHRATSSEVLSKFSDDFLDWIYIDGDHSYEGAITDLRLSFKKVKSGGLIAGDDYVLGNWFADGVVRGLHDFLAETSGRAILSWLIDTQFLIRKL